MRLQQLSLLLITIISCASCEGKLDVVKPDTVTHPGFPDFNFSIRFLGPDSLVVKNDTIAKGIPTLLELYVNQLDFAKKELLYTFSYSIPANTDASIWHQGTEYRMGDKLTIQYAEFKEKVVRITYFPISSGTYTVTITAMDQGNNKRVFLKKITVR